MGHIWINAENFVERPFRVIWPLTRNGDNDINEGILWRTPLDLANAPELLGVLFQEASEVRLGMLLE